MKTTKRIISLLLCLAMVLSMGLVSVFAADGNNGNLISNAGFEDGENGWEFGGRAEMASNNPYTGVKHIYAPANSGTEIIQNLTAPLNGEYRLSAALAGTGRVVAYDAQGNVLAALEHDGGEWTFMQSEPFSLSLRDEVKVVIAADISGVCNWLNVDHVVLAQKDYDATQEPESSDSVGSNEYNILVNADFEQGTGTAGQTSSTLDGWEKENGGRMTNNEYSGIYGFYLNGKTTDYIQQTVTIPATDNYVLTAWLCGNGKISILAEDGEELASQTFSGGSYSQVILKGVALTKGDKVTVKVQPNGGWVNGDEFVFSTEANYDKVFASKVVELINAIGEVGSDSKSAIKAARDAYDALSAAGRAEVTNYSVLVKAERAFANLKSAEIMEMIDALGEITEESVEAVNGARNEYEKLTPEQKEMVLNLPVLEAAEAKLKELGMYVEQKLTPIMGWSSWNNYHVAISEELFVSQIDAMVELGLVDAGYEYFNIDDGFQMGRDPETGLVRSNTKFPSGVQYIAEYAHANGMKAGIYSDCGYNTCASVSDGQGTSPDWFTGEPGNGWGLGVGLYDNWYEDLYQYFITWDFDFIKIDWCGGRDFKPQPLDQQTEYTRIGKYIDQIELEKGEDLIYNVCCWKFPGEWVVDVADSWRVSGDISANFNSVLQQLDACAQLAEYHGPGHVNDMDMLQVGRGMTYEEDKSHFGMWCMLSVPLVLGHDVTTTTDETLEIITNKELIAINQDPAVIMAEPVKTEAGVQTWVKPLGSENSGEKAIALLNRNAYSVSATVTWSEVGFNGDVQVRDLWTHEDLTVGDSYTVTLPAHGCAILKVTGDTSKSTSSIKSIVAGDVKITAEPLDVVDLTAGTEMENAYIINDVTEASATI